ncbi:MAG: hypothetical protein ING66_04195 [Rhodocyclaceae bacterium]|jgi:hypothetical protein|nr:hypothetical protein [Rhodocyclaceae bacterium]MCA3026903.1 hypothetical protein [Rhodocyclaceae bacterium]MCA3027780.1 hypothetical protein [Rhodocyclaceae bacterium]MCA3031733.1 hypothetical protein [Rhodocyclaceae bacterium]MCA3038905.1 hypothetical protein [Rhodocyclaceae bacterium]
MSQYQQIKSYVGNNAHGPMLPAPTDEKPREAYQVFFTAVDDYRWNYDPDLPYDPTIAVAKGHDFYARIDWNNRDLSLIEVARNEFTRQVMAMQQRDRDIDYIPLTTRVVSCLAWPQLHDTQQAIVQKIYKQITFDCTAPDRVARLQWDPDLQSLREGIHDQIRCFDGGQNKGPERSVIGYMFGREHLDQDNLVFTLDGIGTLTLQTTNAECVRMAEAIEDEAFANGVGLNDDAGDYIRSLYDYLDARANCADDDNIQPVDGSGEAV